MSKKNERSIENQQHIDNIVFGGEICLFFETINLEIGDFIEIQHSQNNEIGDEGKNQLATSLANNLTIQELGLYSASIRAIEERNKQGKFKKVCKVMVVGEARTGKSSLVRSLNNQAFDENQSCTNVIEITDFSPNKTHGPLVMDMEDEVKMKIFDFGGQEIFQFVHPLFQTSQQCIVILVVNEFHQSATMIKEQIDFLQNFYHRDILVVSTCFTEAHFKQEEQENGEASNSGAKKIDQDTKLTEMDIEALGIGHGRFVRISNKQRKGIEQVQKLIAEMSKFTCFGWSLSGRGDCLRQYLECMQDNHPVIGDFRREVELMKCEHNHKYTFQHELAILEKSGWLFTFPPFSVIHEKLIVQLLQGLFTIDMLHKGRELEIALVKNGLISNQSFKNYFNKVYEATTQGHLPPDCVPLHTSEKQASWEIVADLMSSFSICHRIGNRQIKGIVACILFPSLLPNYEEARGETQTMWNNLNKQGKKGVTRKMIVAGKYGDKGKVVEFIFPRLMIRMWNEVVDVKLCCRDKFVVRGDATPDDFAQEVENLKNFMIVSKTDNHEIKVERIGECFGRMMQVEEEFDRLFVEFRMCFGVILSHNQSRARNFEVKLECSTCETEICTSSLANLNHLDQLSELLWYQERCKGCNKAYTALERIGN